MFVSSIYSYLGGWKLLQDDEHNPIEDIEFALKSFTPLNLSRKHITKAFNGNSDYQPIYSLSLPLALEYFLLRRGWKEISKSEVSSDLKGLGLKNILHKGNTSVKLITSANKPLFSNWMIYETPIIYCSGLSSISVLLIPEEDVLKILKDKSKSKVLTFEKSRKILRKLSPLKSNSPFVILGFSNQKELFKPDIYEIKPTNNSQSTHSLSVSRTIEFPEEYFKSGITIISEFCNYLRELNLSNDAKVRIEQNGLSVKLYIETLSGDPIIMTRVLSDYYETLEKNTTTNSNPDDKLHDLIKLLLLKENSPKIEINTNSNSDSKSHSDAIAENNIEINQSVSTAISATCELQEIIKKFNGNTSLIDDVIEKLDKIEEETDSSKVRKSSAMYKFNQLIGEINQSTSSIGKILHTIEGGTKLAADISEKYNSLASWCGLPQVPGPILSIIKK